MLDFRCLMLDEARAENPGNLIQIGELYLYLDPIKNQASNIKNP